MGVHGQAPEIVRHERKHDFSHLLKDPVVLFQYKLDPFLRYSCALCFQQFMGTFVIRTGRLDYSYLASKGG